MKCGPEMLKLLNELENKELLLETTSLISKTDRNGKIVYTNQKFCEVSGYTQAELIGQDHNILNSGYHSHQFWKEMYNIVVKQKKIWYGLVTNKTKSGSLYYVKTWIQAEFDKSSKITGYITLRHDVTELIMKQIEIESKNAYLEYAAKILRHDMHSGIITYIPRGVSALKRKLANTDVISKYKLEIPIKIINEGLKHTQKVYHGIYEFTNLVKNNGYLTKKIVNLNAALTDYLDGSSYCDNVIIKDLPNISVSESLFCISIDNLIKNGLRYNDSSTRLVEVSYDKTSNSIHIDDNGRGMNVEDLSILIQPYTRNPLQKETGTGLGLNISVAILKEHGFKLSCTSSKFDTGTRVIISLGNEPTH